MHKINVNYDEFFVIAVALASVLSSGITFYFAYVLGYGHGKLDKKVKEDEDQD